MSDPGDRSGLRSAALRRILRVLDRWFGPKTAPPPPTLTDIMAWQWGLVERLARPEAVGGDRELEAWRRLRKEASPHPLPWEFLLDAIDAGRRAARRDLAGAETAYLAVVEDLEARCKSAGRSRGQDRDGHDLEFLRLALALALTRLAELRTDASPDEVGTGAHEDAVRLLEKAERHCPREVYVRERLVHHLVSAGRSEEAEEQARGIASLDRSADSRLRSGRMLGSVRWRRAREAEERGRFEDAASELARCEAVLRRIVLERGEKRDRDDLAVVVRHGALLRLRDRRDAEAIRMLDAARADDGFEEETRRALLALETVCRLGGTGGVAANIAALREIAGKTGPWTLVAREAGAANFRPDVGRALELRLLRAAQRARGTDRMPDVVAAELVRFSETSPRPAPTVVLVPEIRVEYVPEAFGAEGGEDALNEALEAERRRFATTWGFDLPRIVLLPRDESEEGDLGWVVVLRGGAVVEFGPLRRGHELVVGPAAAFREAGLVRLPAAPPGFRGDAAWVPRSGVEALERLGARRIPPVELLAGHLRTAIEKTPGSFLTRDEIHRLLERNEIPDAATGSVPETRLVGAVRLVALAMLESRLPILDFRRIHETVRRGLSSGSDLGEVLAELGASPPSGLPGARDPELRASPGEPPKDSSPSEPRAPRDRPVRLTVRVRAGPAVEPRIWRARFSRRLAVRADALVAAIAPGVLCRVEVELVSSLPPGTGHALSVEGAECRVRRADVDEGSIPDDPERAAEEVFETLFRNRRLLATGPVGGGSSTGGPTPGILTEVAFEHGIALDGLREAWPELGVTGPQDPFADHAIELLVARRAAPAIALHVSPDMLDSLPIALEDLRRELFWELGFWVPPFEPRAHPELAAGELALGFNDLTLPVRRLADPGAPGSAAEEHVRGDVRVIAPALLHLRTVMEILGDLGSPGFHPRLASDLLAAHDVATVLRVLRELVRDGCSIQDQRAILDALTASGDPWPRPGRSDPAPVDELVERARWALRPSIATSLTGPSRTHVSVFELADDLARGLPDAGARARLLDALHAARCGTFLGERGPVLVTPPGDRLRVRRAIEIEFPDQRVVSEDELGPELHRQRLAILRE